MMPTSTKNAFTLNVVDTDSLSFWVVKFMPKNYSDHSFNRFMASGQVDVL